MSMLFDVDFFYRDFGKFLNLSNDSLLLHYRFAGIIGSKHDYKISEEKLAEQFGVTDRTIRRWLSPLVKLGLMNVEQDKYDKRKNRYSFPNFLPNYYQDRAAYAINPKKFLDDLPPQLFDELFNNEFSTEKYRTELSGISTKYRTELSGTSESIGQSCPVSKNENNDFNVINQEDVETEKIPNRKKDINRNNTNRKRGKKIPPNFIPSGKHLHLAETLRINANKESLKFIDYFKSKGTVRIDWDAAFSNWLRKAAEFKEEKESKSLKKESPMERSLRMCTN